MRPLKGFAWGAALALLAAGASPSSAAWCNAFQVCCNSCGNSAPATSFASPMNSPMDGCCDPCPKQVCTTRMVQRCYYQPVTCYTQKTWTEQVTSYRTSFYYEPVTTFRQSCYFDPCSCSYKQVMVPQTCMQLRSRCCPVTSFLQRSCMVPSTSYRQVFYWEPQTSCCNVPSCPSPCPPSCPTSCPPSCPCPSDRNGGSPQVDERREPPMLPRVDERREPTPMERQPPLDGMNGTSGYRSTTPVRPVAPPAVPPRVRLDRIVSLPPSPGVEGQVVRADRRPQPNAKVMFVNAERHETRQSATAGADGQFRVALAAGTWWVYVNDGTGQMVRHSKVEVKQNETRQVTLVSSVR